MRDAKEWTVRENKRARDGGGGGVVLVMEEGRTKKERGRGACRLGYDCHRLGRAGNGHGLHNFGPHASDNQSTQTRLRAWNKLRRVRTCPRRRRAWQRSTGQRA
jgi:hypothetical protein